MSVICAIGNCLPGVTIISVTTGVELLFGLSTATRMLTGTTKILPAIVIVSHYYC